MAMNFSKAKQAKQYRTDIDGNSPDSHKVVKQSNVESPEEWEKQIQFWRTHLDIFIEDYFSVNEEDIEKPVRLFDIQKVVARNCGNCTNVKDVESRSLGKTYKMAWILSALGVLYSNNRILVVSGTVKQAVIVAKYIETLANENPNLAREIVLPVKISKDGATITFKSGSTMECRAMNADGSNLRGLREKIIYIDESLLVKTEVITSVLLPMLQYQRDVAIEQGFKDFPSKLFETSSAYLKTCDFYQRFLTTLRNMKNGVQDEFACAFNYKAGVRIGIIDEDFVNKQRLIMTEAAFQMEWNARFVGNENGSFLPYDLTERCRNLDRVELFQPRDSSCNYILSLDVATSAKDTADNACITVIKISEKIDKNGEFDGTYHKYLVYLRTYHGYGQQALADEVRKTCVRFPAISKVIVDFNAIGEGVVALLNFPYIDDEGKEHMPLIPDDTGYTGNKALPIVRCFRGNNDLNNRLATKLKLYFENKTLHLPIQSVFIKRDSESNISIDDEESGSKKRRNKQSRQMLLEEVSIYTETDALQYECSTIIPKFTVSGKTAYDTALSTQHKDRYSSLGMAIEYISQLEDENRNKYNNNSSNSCWGRASRF